MDWKFERFGKKIRWKMVEFYSACYTRQERKIGDVEKVIERVWKGILAVIVYLERNMLIVE